jgi:hypothetical protein
MEIIASLSAARIDPMLPGVLSVPAAPDAAAVQQFAALMQPPAAEAASAAAQATATEPQSFGDRVLSGMHNVSTEFRDSMTRVSDTLRAEGPMGMHKMLSLQLDMSMSTVQLALVNKAISRSTQNLDQLVRVQ